MAESIATDKARNEISNFEATEGTEVILDTTSNVLELATTQARVDIASNIRSQVEFLRDIRSSRDYIVEPSAIGEMASPGAMQLVWRLMIVTGTAAGITVIGAFLTVVAVLDSPLDPNPLIALSLLLFGMVLLATVVKIVRGDGGDG